MRHAFKSLRFELRNILARYPSLHMPFLRRQRLHVVNAQTEIVIDGFPRSGNSFAVNAFKMAQPIEVHIAHHTHAPVQVIWAVQHNIPTLVLIREPKDSAISFHIRSPWISMAQALKGYMVYYETLMPYRTGFYTATFTDVISDFGKIMRQMNEKFDTNFTPFEHTEENVQAYFQQTEKSAELLYGAQSLDKMGRPNAYRKAKKQDLSRTIDQSPHLQKLLLRAENTFRLFLQ